MLRRTFPTKYARAREGLATFPDGPDDRLGELNRLIQDVVDKVRIEMDLERKPGYREAQYLSKLAHDALDRMADEILGSPVRSISDLVVRARLAEYWSDRMCGYVNRDELYMDELTTAILALVGATPEIWHREIVSNVPLLIKVLGGRHEVANRWSVSAIDIAEWEREDYLPPELIDKATSEVKAKGYRVGEINKSRRQRAEYFDD